jgi:hypothetical protein
MAHRSSERWQELWLSASNANDDDATISAVENPGDWEETINRTLAQMLESGTAVERAIAARLLLAESYLGRLYREGPDELIFASDAD